MRLNPEKPYFYVKLGELRKKVADQQKKQQEAQKKAALSDYERSLVMSSQPRKRVGNGVPQLREVSKPVPHLIVPNQYGSNEDFMPKKSLALSELDSLDHYFGQSGLNIEDIAANIGCQTFEKAEVVDQWWARYEPGRSLFNPQHLHELGTQMFAINKWFMEASKGEIIGFLFVLDNITTSVEMTSYTCSSKNCTIYVTSTLSTMGLPCIKNLFFLFLKTDFIFLCTSAMCNSTKR